MIPRMLLGEPGCLDRRVDLSGADIGMPKHLLDRSQIGAASQKVGREGMAQDMRRHGGRGNPRRNA